MHGMLHLSADAAPTAAQFLGILYAEDFDLPPSDAAPDGSILEASAPPTLTEDDVAAACADAVAAARREWDAAEARERARMLVALASAMTSAKVEAEAAASATAEATVAAILAALAGALPKFCTDHGPKEVRGLLDRLLPMLRTEPKITIRVHADLVAELRQDMLDLQAEYAGSITVSPAAVERGDVRVTWENGSLTRDTRQILQAMQDALGQLGLMPSVEASPKRKLAYAE